MTINRIKSPYYIPTIASFYAYSSNLTTGQTISTFVANGAQNTTAGVTYRVHSFDGTPGTYQMTFDTAGLVDLLIIGGGGGGGHGENSTITNGGGGGAGGLLQIYGYGVLAQTYSITVGDGGAGAVASSTVWVGSRGLNSSFGDLIAYGGGPGTYSGYLKQNCSGGSGGGDSNNSAQSANGTPYQGNSSGRCIQATYPASGGGGAGGPGGDTNTGTTTGPGGTGGPGLSLNFRGYTESFCGGGGGGGGAGGGAATHGGGNGSISQAPGSNATYYGGGGGGAGNYAYTGGKGFQGLVIVRYPISS